ncbi:MULTISPECIES: hypothetical protein [unclassified Rickettsia]|uniref:hypothetical protein n=1 Tax=unclassified Rickettsia TaxID=114295 RepID=UPI0031333300
MIKSRHDTAFFQRSYSSGLDHGIQSFYQIFFWIPWSKPRDDIILYAITYLRNNALRE